MFEQTFEPRTSQIRIKPDKYRRLISYVILLENLLVAWLIEVLNFMDFLRLLTDFSVVT